jgi:hypothetical protein
LKGKIVAQEFVSEFGDRLGVQGVSNTDGAHVKTISAEYYKRTENSAVTNERIQDALDGKAASTHTHGNITNGGALQTTDVTIASGDKLVITVSADSNKVARASISFDGSTATKALTQKGTWETFNNYTHPTTSGNKHIPSGGSSGQFLGWNSDGTAKWVANPNTDTKNTAGSTDTSSKIFLIGATSQAANPQTYSQDTTYVDTDATLASTKVRVAEKCTLQFNTTTNALDFVFA